MKSTKLAGRIFNEKVGGYIPPVLPGQSLTKVAQLKRWGWQELDLQGLSDLRVFQKNTNFKYLRSSS